MDTEQFGATLYALTKKSQETTAKSSMPLSRKNKRDLAPRSRRQNIGSVDLGLSHHGGSRICERIADDATGEAAIEDYYLIFRPTAQDRIAELRILKRIEFGVLPLTVRQGEIELMAPACDETMPSVIN
jgi:hypothetical protein